jgi:hypothetical protein
VPVSADHSGLAEVTAAIAPVVDERLRPLLSFELGAGAVRAIAANLVSWLTLAISEPETWERTRTAPTQAAHDRFGWEQVAAGVIAAAQGRLADLPLVPGQLPAAAR